MRPVIFLSAATRELKSARQLVANTLTFLGYEPEWEDIFGTGEGDLPGMLRERIEASAGVIQIVGRTYGAEPPAPDATFGRVSYTQYEALYARQRGKKVWYLFLDDAFPADPCDPEPEEKAQLQRAYRERVHGGNDLWHPIKDRAELEASVLKLRDELAPLRRRAKRWAAAVLVLLVVIVGAVAWQMKSSHEQRGEIGKQSAKIDVVLQRHAQMELALARLAQADAQVAQGGEKLSSEERRARAYALLEKELKLTAGTLAKELPGFALEVYNRPDATALQRAQAAYALGKYAEAEPIARNSGEQEKAAFEKSQHQAEEHRKKAVAGFELAGWSAEAQIQYARALEHFRSAAPLTSRERDAVEWARVQYDIAYALDHLGRAGETEPILREVIAVLQPVLGPEHVYVLMSRNNLACALKDQGKYVEAEQEHRAVLALRERVLGPEHPHTLGSRDSLATCMRHQGKSVEAERESRAVLAIWERVLGSGHPDTLGSRMGLAIALNDQHRYTEAEQEYRTVLAAMGRHLDPEHPDVLATRNNLANTLRYQGKSAEAEQEHREVLGIRQRVLGPEHPLTLSSQYNLAVALQVQNKYAEAEVEHRAVLAIYERVLGLEHPDVFRSCFSLALVLASQEKGKEALEFARRAEDGYKRTLGNEHPAYRNANGLREDLQTLVK